MTEIIPGNRGTWPSGDKVWDVARAIATAEGYGVDPENNPTRLNNPGDISDGGPATHGPYPAEEHSGSSVTHFPDAETGWHWLYNKLNKVRLGKSHVYFNTMTWTEFAQTWAGDWESWVETVTVHLGVSVEAKVGDYWA